MQQNDVPPPPTPGGDRPQKLQWNAATVEERGPVITKGSRRNAIGAVSGPYSVYRALSIATGKYDPGHVNVLELTEPIFTVGPHKTWFSGKISTVDCFGHMPSEGMPTISITRAGLDLPEIKLAMMEGRLKPDGKVLHVGGKVSVNKCAVDPVWHLPSMAKRLGLDEKHMRESLFKHTNGMFPELVSRPDIKVFLPPIGGATAYIFGDPAKLGTDTKLTARVHDECNGSDVFGSDICTCRPYLTHAIEECVAAAQKGEVGLMVYYRKEGRSLGEVVKYLVYNRRKRQEGGDTAERYFDCTREVTGVEDARFQEFMPDILLWLGITRIDRLISMSSEKYDALVAAGITIGERVSIPDNMIPDDAFVEINAKVARGYYVEEGDTIKRTGPDGRPYEIEDDIVMASTVAASKL